jgi:hypothetical protein
LSSRELKSLHALLQTFDIAAGIWLCWVKDKAHATLNARSTCFSAFEALW